MKLGPEMMLAASLAIREQLNGTNDPNQLIALESANKIINSPISQALLFSYTCVGCVVDLPKNTCSRKRRKIKG